MINTSLKKGWNNIKFLPYKNTFISLRNESIEAYKDLSTHFSISKSVVTVTVQSQCGFRQKKYCYIHFVLICLHMSGTLQWICVSAYSVKYWLLWKNILSFHVYVILKIVASSGTPKFCTSIANKKWTCIEKCRWP